MDFAKICRENRAQFHELLNSYYRAAEDADTPQKDVDAFIDRLYGCIEKGEICGELAVREEQTAGFVLYNVDAQDGPFCRKPGYGTILEIGLIPTVRGRGLGRELVEHAEKALRRRKAKHFYVCAYGPAQAFWKKMGYRETDEKDENGLPVYVK